jgi:hypothetical protein
MFSNFHFYNYNIKNFGESFSFEDSQGAISAADPCFAIASAIFYSVKHFTFGTIFSDTSWSSSFTFTG